MHIYKISGQLIPQECFGILIRNLPYLSYLFLRKCYEVDIDYLRRVMRQSPSSCLKINHLDGIITWNNETKHLSVDRHSNNFFF